MTFLAYSGHSGWVDFVRYQVRDQFRKVGRVCDDAPYRFWRSSDVNCSFDSSHHDTEPTLPNKSDLRNWTRTWLMRVVCQAERTVEPGVVFGSQQRAINAQIPLK